MVEKVLIAAVRSPDRHVMMDARLASRLVEHGTFQYVTKVEEPEPKPKKRSYKRRDLQAE